MIDVDQFLLVIKRMIQHLALCGVLYVKEVVHEEVRTIVGVSTGKKFLQLIIRKCLALVRCFDQYAFWCFVHGLLVMLNRRPKSKITQDCRDYEIYRSHRPRATQGMGYSALAPHLVRLA